MPSGNSFVTPALRSKSFSYGTLMDFADDERSQRPSTSDQYRSLTSYEDIDDEEMVKFTEETPLVSKTDRQTSTTSTTSFHQPPGRISQWITRITPPFLLPPDATYLESYVVRNGDAEGKEVIQKQESVASQKKLVFSTRDKVNIAMIAAASFCSTVVFSCIAPFFPEEAKKKGSTDTITGFVFGIFELVIFLTSPIFGRYITTIGSNFMYGTGLCVTGVTAILFGLLNLVPSGTTFIVFAFVIRIVEALGDAAIVTASFAIVAKAFTFRVATIIGILETFGGLGFAAGPPIGGALYEAGGYQLPFAVLGSFLIVAGAVSFVILPKQNDSPTKSTGSIFHLLRMQAVWTMVLSIIVAAVSIAFLDPTLQPHLSDFNLSPVLVGLMFLITGGTYAASAPFWGYLIDRKDCARWVMLFGCASTFVSLLLIGPSPIFPFEKQLWLVAVSEVFMGFGLGALFIPPFQQCLIAARLAGYPDTFETYGLISGLFQSSLSFGAFFGPTIGGFGVELMGFAWTASALALLHFIVATLIILLIVSEKKRSKRPRKSDSETLARVSETMPSPSSPFASHHELRSASLCLISDQPENR